MNLLIKDEHLGYTTVYYKIHQVRFPPVRDERKVLPAAFCAISSACGSRTEVGGRTGPNRGQGLTQQYHYLHIAKKTESLKSCAPKQFLFLHGVDMNGTKN